MRLGGPLFEKFSTPGEWIEAVRVHGYGAAYCPVGLDATDDDVQSYVTAAKEAGIVIERLVTMRKTRRDIQ